MTDHIDNLEQAQTRHERALAGFESGAIVGKEAITLAQIIVTISAMKLELQTGLKAARGVNVFKNVKQIFGWKGNNKQILAQLQAYRYQNHPLPPIMDCPVCGKTAMVEVSAEDNSGMDLTDGTNMHCHPIYEGCDTGFNAPPELLEEVRRARKAMIELMKKRSTGRG